MYLKHSYLSYENQCAYDILLLGILLDNMHNRRLKCCESLYLKCL